MTEEIRFELNDFGVAGTREVLDDPRGWAGETIRYGTRGSSPDARLTVMVKLSRQTSDDGRGITATDDGDAAGLGINHLFDAVSSSIPREKLKSDLDSYLRDRLSLDTWLPTTIEVDGFSRSAFLLRYADAAAHVADVGGLFLIVVTAPAVETPSVRSRDQ